jgi:RecJ-like exonuclease
MATCLLQRLFRFLVERAWITAELERQAIEREQRWQKVKHDKGPITEEEMTPMSKETELLLQQFAHNLKQPIGERKQRLKIAFNIGEECPSCYGKGKIEHMNTKQIIDCNYCEGKGAIGIVEIRAETEMDARRIYSERFNVDKAV